MRSRSSELEWLPLWIDKYLFGSTRIELQPDERSVWMDLMVLAAKDQGHVQANIGIPYPMGQLAGFLCITEELLLRTIKRCIEVGKVIENEDHTLFLPSWHMYAFSPRHKRRLVSESKQMSSKEDNMAEKADTILYKDIKYNIKETHTHAFKKEQKPTLDQFFDRFWQAYPKKRSKGQAEKAFSKINPDEQLLETMISIIGRAKKSPDWIRENGRYIPYPSTWLNSKGWEDQPTECISPPAGIPSAVQDMVKSMAKDGWKV